ncbi:MAG: Asp-tRNA(Asn)/Glu-tRNA(Gln) amidotransferase subunit GatC [Actinomycetota bacterium]|jgi:aspartyl-tRNA(Asn)/glutamyl-tRNA(Gln) amidotransferase subunit C|nr:Asp-tRNA(Asn)/Glu-tRNA(Gln) amidotransferase subunit GatC [Actinomycetota bacterium]
MSAITRDEVAHLAALARIDLTNDELDRLAGQLGVVLDAVARVGEVAADDIPPTSHPLPLTNVQRPDEPRPCLTAAEALAGAPATDRGRFQVPRILDED